MELPPRMSTCLPAPGSPLFWLMSTPAARPEIIWSTLVCTPTFAAAANVGVQTNVDQMISGRAAGVDISQNNGEPGAGRQVLIRGGSSIGVGGATNDPLYVVDGVPINNTPTEPQAMGVFGDPMLARN